MTLHEREGASWSDSVAEGPQESAEQVPPLDHVAEQLQTLVKGIEQRRRTSYEQGQATFMAIQQEALPSMGEAALIEIEQTTGVQERLDQNNVEQQRLAEKTVASVRAVIDLLAGDLPPLERQQLLESTASERVGFGAFYNTYRVGKESEAKLVVKDLKLNYLFGSQEAARIIAGHAVEAERVQTFFGDMVPKAAFVVFPEHQEEFAKAKKKFESTDQKIYDFVTFAKIQIDRRLQQDYGRRDVPGEKRGGMDTLLGKAGEALRSHGMVRQESVGVMVQEYVRGITFADFFEKFTSENCPNYQQLQTSIKTFIERTRSFNQEYALLWHRFDSDNVVIEVDQDGMPTGQVKILDVNYTERPAEKLRSRLATAMDERMLKPLEEKFDLQS